MTAPEYLPIGVIPDRQVMLWRDAVVAAGDPGHDGPSTMERRFGDCGWQGIWRNGIFTWHHHHAAAHEVLGIARGWVRVTLGGTDRTEVTLRAGDVVLLPAGTAHRNEEQSPDLVVIGAYPPGQHPDMVEGVPEGAATLASIAAVPAPARDPVTGEPFTAWR